MASVKELEKNKVQIEFEVDAAAFEDAISKAYMKNRASFNVPGFRKGKAPRHLIELNYGPTIFYEDAFDICFPENYSKAVEETGLDVVSRPENVDIVSIDKETGIKITADVYTKPDVTLGQYMGVEVEKVSYPVTDEDIDKEIDKKAEQQVRWEDVERPAQMGDKVVIDYSGSIDGEKFEGGTAEAQTLDLGSSMFIPGFEEQVVGMEIGQDKDINVPFPEDYHEKTLAGKDSVFAVKLIAIKEKHKPEINDDFAQDVSDFDTLAEYREDVAKNLREQAAKREKYELEDKVIAKVVENSEVDIPQCMIEDAIDSRLREMEYSMNYQGISMEMYLQYTGSTIEQLRDSFKDQAAQTVRTKLVLDKVMDTEKTEADQEAIDKQMEDYAKQTGRELDKFKAEITDNEKQYMKERANFEKLIDTLVGAANIIEKAEEEPAPAEAEKGEE